jgi:hypothetical protein
MQLQGCTMMVLRIRTYLVRAEYTLAMLCHVVEILDEQGNDCFGWASGKSTASGLNVTSCSNANPIITPIFPVGYLE